ncbi:unnamed protein product [Closterium sp. NIES-53]
MAGRRERRRRGGGRGNDGEEGEATAGRRERRRRGGKGEEMAGWDGVIVRWEEEAMAEWEGEVTAEIEGEDTGMGGRATAGWEEKLLEKKLGWVGKVASKAGASQEEPRTKPRTESRNEEHQIRV